MPCTWNRSVSRILYSGRNRSGDHSSSPTVTSWIERPTRRLRTGNPITPPYLVLHREEFAWPRVLPRTPVRSYIKPTKEPHRFTHHHPHFTRFQISRSEVSNWRRVRLAGLFSVALVVVRENLRFQISN